MRILGEVYSWKKRRPLVAVMTGLGWLVLSGVPTDIIGTSLFTRMTPVEWWNYPVWLGSAVLVGLLAATYVTGSGAGCSSGSRGKALGGGLLSVFAIGCPICNKLVVMALGVSGALAYFTPIQPILGILSIGLLLYTLHMRLSTEQSCPGGRGVASPEREVAALPMATIDSKMVQNRKGECKR
jgi:hypothetical protein